jgi:hypothetical protein
MEKENLNQNQIDDKKSTIKYKHIVVILLSYFILIILIDVWAKSNHFSWANLFHRIALILKVILGSLIVIIFIMSKTVKGFLK